jgi:diaminohydroxyphosphoribosylaminopyrimidine deaminase/5-amino-6-(5-phosphoribosylamino)uracil reductase
MGEPTASRQSDQDQREGILAQAFARALDAAAQFEGATAPNPPVGCVLLDADGSELVVAAHAKAGELHAEAAAIRLATEAGLIDRIHTVVVTLEPCNHTGRTPPCTAAILATPAKEVWIGTRDPNASVPGHGAETLRAAGLTVRFLEELRHPDMPGPRAHADRLIAPFAKLSRAGLPWITVKQALALDGTMLPPAGRKTFTSPASLTLAHQLRKRADAILTGSGTVLADAPEFTVRHVPDFPGKRRKLIILDRRGRVTSDYVDAARGRGFEVLIEPSWEEAIQNLGRAGVLQVLVEAGPSLTRQVLDDGAWDEHYLIEQGAGPDGDDRVTVRRPRHTTSSASQRNTDVFWHH